MNKAGPENDRVPGGGDRAGPEANCMVSGGDRAGIDERPLGWLGVLIEGWQVAVDKQVLHGLARPEEAGPDGGIEAAGDRAGPGLATAGGRAGPGSGLTAAGDGAGPDGGVVATEGQCSQQAPLVTAAGALLLSSGEQVRVSGLTGHRPSPPEEQIWVWGAAEP